MSKIQLFIACTLDGFIARENGSLDWLFELPNPDQIDHGYNDFINGIDIVIMGRKTYDEVLGFGIDWPYSNCKTYIVTKNENYTVKTENTLLLHTINIEVIENLESESQKNIWLVGGGDLITQFLNENAIDDMALCMIPIILGKGIQLFPNQPKETKFEFVRSEAFKTGVVNLTYKKIK
ncbi:MAG: dihydrofolate reductase family protein [Bacteroidetes bacterium]|nr:dihydrofolate reductase family protein [Bacteroidota bacterium]